MDGCSTQKSTSLETLVIQNITNTNDLKAKLRDIIKAGKDYQYDVSACMKSLLNSSDHDIVLLSAHVIAELAKCVEKRPTFAQKEIIEPILDNLRKELTTDRKEFVGQCCRALGNLCCDCDTARKIVLDCNGILTLAQLLRKTLEDNTFNDIKRFTSQILLNYSIGGKEFSESIKQHGVIELQHKILLSELEKDDMNDDTVSSALLILCVINENSPEYQFEPEVTITVLNVLKETANIEISEICLDYLHSQTDFGSVKSLLANEGGVQLVCDRLEQLVQRHEAGELNAADSEVEAVVKRACDLIVIVLTGDEAMHIVYNKGLGETYLTMVRWLNSTNYTLLTTAALAAGNFARQDDYCINMMKDGMYDKLLDIFETYHGFAVRMRREPNEIHPISSATVVQIQHAALAALRNLTVPRANKRMAAAKGRAAGALLRALPDVEDHPVAYKLLATLRMLVDGQEGVARLVASDKSALKAITRWACSGEVGAGAAGEAPRLLAWTLRQLRHDPVIRNFVEVEGCVSSLIYMLVSPHSVMQNEAILALTLLAVDRPQNEYCEEYEKSLIAQAISSEIGNHVAVLLQTNCAKMPVELAEVLLVFLDITSKKNKLALDYKEAKVHESLEKLSDARKDFSDALKTCISAVITTISDNRKEEE